MRREAQSVFSRGVEGAGAAPPARSATASAEEGARFGVLAAEEKGAFDVSAAEDWVRLTYRWPRTGCV